MATKAIPVTLFLFIAIRVFTQTDAATAHPKYIIILPKALVRSDHYSFFVQVDLRLFVIDIIAKNVKTKEKRAAMQRAVVSRQARLTFGIPFEKYRERTIELEFRISECYTTRDSCMRQPGKVVIQEKTKLSFAKNSLLIFADTSKPLYKPNDILKFRLLPLLIGNLKPYGLSTNLTFDRIWLEAPDGNVMAQWRNVSWISAFNGYSFKLTKDPPLGKWKIKAQIFSQRDEEEIEVTKYVLPRFLIDINTPGYVYKNAMSVKFSICAKYTTGLPLKGTVNAAFCIRDKYSRPSPNPYCINVIGKFNGLNTCLHFQNSTVPLQLLKATRHSYIILKANVTEEGTQASLTKTKTGIKLVRTLCQLLVKAPRSFNPGLPLYVTVKSTKPDGSPMANVPIRATISKRSYRYYGMSWGYSTTIHTDADGSARFIANPPPLTTGGFYINFQSIIQHENHELVQIMRQGTKQVFVSTNPSSRKIYLQLYPRNQLPQNPCKTKKFTLRLQSNNPIEGKKFHVIISSGGILIDYQMINATSLPSRECKDMNRDDLGHYKCLRNEKDQQIIRCLPGWRGTNCLTPVCVPRCMKGFCTRPGKCDCQTGWAGSYCTICQRRLGCEHGYCSRGNDCNCYPGWVGYRCNVPNRNRWYQMRRRWQVRPPPPQFFSYTKTPHKTERIKDEKISIFERDIQLNIKNSYGPISYATIFMYSGEEGQSEIVAVDVTLENLQECREKQVPTSFNFDKTVARPGENVSGIIKTTGKNVSCAFSLRDTAFDAFERPEGVSFSELGNQLRRIASSVRKYTAINSYRNLQRQPCGYGYSRLITKQEGLNSFYRNGFHVITNSLPINNECIPRPMVFESAMAPMDDLQMAAERGPPNIGRMNRKKIFRKKVKLERRKKVKKLKQGIQKLKKVIRPRLRKHFPETWKFELLHNPKNKINLTVPDTITNWRSEMYCLSSAGIGIARPQNLQVFQPFFLQMALPYSIVRGESVKIPVKLFSYTKSCFQVSLTATESPQLQIIGFRQHITCVCAFEHVTVNFTLKPKELGKYPFKVTAMASTSKRCPNKFGISDRVRTHSDAVQRQLLVEPEGLPKELVMGDIICPRSQEHSISFLPTISSPDLVPKSDRGYISWSGEVLSASVENLDKLVRMPTGCGEQNMISLVPSVYILDYFLQSKINQPEIIEKAKGYINYGYKRELRYRHPDGSFSAFGPARGAKGSTWLTAFVLKSFVAASRYVEIPHKPLIHALSFLEKQQNKKNGCFNELGRVIHSDMRGGVDGSSSEISLSVYVLSALLEASKHTILKSKLKSDVIQNAITCIKMSTPSVNGNWSPLSTYTIALRSYVLSSWSPENDMTRQYQKQLDKRMVVRDGYQFWENEKVTTPTDMKHTRWRRNVAPNVETTGYAILAKFGQTNLNLPKLLSPLRWLINERNERGGWYSTQDTVIALQALAEASIYLGDTSRGKTYLEVAISKTGLVSGKDENDIITPSNKIVLRKREIRLNKDFTLRINGTGCAIFQLSLLYNVKKIGRDAALFEIQANTLSIGSECTISKLSICVRYTGGDLQSNMAIVRVKVATGWAVNMRRTKLGFKRIFKSGSLEMVETDNEGTLNLYFDSLSSNRLCLVVWLERRFFVENLQPMLVEVYDYYKPDKIQERSVPLYTGKCAVYGGRPPIPGIIPPTETTNFCPQCVESVNFTKAAGLIQDTCDNKKRMMIGAIQMGSLWEMTSEIGKYINMWRAPVEIRGKDCSCTPSPTSLFVSLSDVAIDDRQLVLDDSWVLLNATNVNSINVTETCMTTLRQILLMDSVL